MFAENRKYGDWWAPFLCMGITFARLSLSGKIPRVIDSLKMQARGRDMSDFTNLSSFTGMLKGPVEFPFFKEMMISSISEWVTGQIKKEFIFLFFRWSRGDLFVLDITWVEILTKKLLNRFSIFWGSWIVSPLAVSWEILWREFFDFVLIMDFILAHRFFIFDLLAWK